MEPETSTPREVREWRRMRALELKEAGWKQRAIATALGVTEGAVSHWLTTARQGGVAALRSRPVSGAPAYLSAAQRRQLPEFLWHGAQAYGFAGAVWTCRRVGQVIQEEFGVTYSKSQVSRLLRALNWSPQQPDRRALQRDAAVIAHWRAVVWPALYAQARDEGRTLVFVDEAGFYLLPGVVKPTPHAGRRRCGGSGKRATISRCWVAAPPTAKSRYWRAESLNGRHTIAFLEHLRRQIGERWLVIGDGSPIHRRPRSRTLCAVGEEGGSR